MSEDDLQDLTNRQLRDQLIQHGLPNVPVTDSSRKILIKKLLAVQAAGAAGETGVPKKSNRRETIAVVGRDLPSRAVAKEETNITVRAADKRRTLAVPPQPAAAITTRRRSSASQQSVPKKINVAELSSIILESDEEDELVVAVEKAEKANEKSQTTTVQRSTRAGSAPKIPVAVQAKPVLEKIEEKEPQSLPYQREAKTLRKEAVEISSPKIAAFSVGQDQFTRASGVQGAAPFQFELPPRDVGVTRSRASYIPTARQPPVDSARLYMPSVAGGGLYSPSSYAQSYTASRIPSKSYASSQYYQNEFSDEEPGSGSGFLSDFARKLERKQGALDKVDGVDGSRHNKSMSLGQMVASLDRKYQLKRNIAFVVVILFVISLFILFWQ